MPTSTGRWTHCKRRFGRQCVPTHVPIGSEAGFKGVISLLGSDQNLPADMAQEIEEARERLTEAVAESDDDLATRYLEGESISEQELKDGLRKGVASGQIVPVLPCSATSEVGVTGAHGRSRGLHALPQRCRVACGTERVHQRGGYASRRERQPGRPGIQDHRRPIRG